jgi:signal transduction histidine kinase/CheY-like chemotaxis protein
MKRIKALVRKYIFSEEIPLDARILNMVCAFGMLAALTATIARIIERVPLITLFSMAGILASVIMLMIVSNRFHLYRIGTWITLIMLGDVFFPLIFFTNGGVESGMAAYFTLSMVITFLLARGLSCVLILTSHVVIIIACHVVSLMFPQTVVRLNTFQLYIDNIQSFLVAGLFIGFVIKFQDRLYLHEKKKGEHSAAALARQDRLLHVINDTAAALLTPEEGNFEEALRNGMGMMAACVSVDRIYIWRISAGDGTSDYSTVFEWAANPDLRQNLLNFPFNTSLPRWEKVLGGGGCISGPVSGLPREERECLKPFNMSSILVIPVFFQEIFWGFVSFDDCKKERNFSGDEISILRSGSLLLANAVIRNEMLEEMRKADRLLRTMNNAATVLFKSDVDEFGRDLRNCIGMMARCVDADHVVIMKNETRDGELYAKGIFEWTAESGGDETDIDCLRRVHTQEPACAEEACGGTKGMYPESNTLPKQPYPDRSAAGLVDFSYRRDLPGWETALSGGQFIRGPVHRLSPAERETFSRLNIISILVIPVFSLEQFWGFVSFNYRRVERDFSTNEEAILRSGGLLIANAILRNEMTKSLVQAREEALSSTRAKSNFLANMSHEMRTPMNAIIGMTSIARTSPDPEKKDYCLSKIDDASIHLLGVINDVLDMSKIEANKFELSAETFNFEKMLQKVVNVINFRVEEKKQILSVHIDRHIPRTLIGDDQRLAQVITNLLSNAVKFTPEGGSIDLDTRFEGEKEGLCTIRIQVKDSGIGISGDQQERLFNSFEQAESTTTRKFGGTGLGLAISKRIVEMMGGTIRIESELGRGAAFIFTIQARRGAAEAHETRYSSAGWDRLRLLAVDDDKNIREYFADIMGRFGIHCDTASGGEEALALIEQRGGYDLYFVDWKMPGMNGIELSRRITAASAKDRDPAQKAVVIMISSTEWTVIEEEAKNAGVDKYLPKPLFPSSIADCISECMGAGKLVPDTKPENRMEAGSFRGHTILLAEDVEINQEILLALLEPTGLSIDCAANGVEAVRMFSADPGRYDMIFMDLQMPEMDGYEATRRVRAIEEERREKAAGPSRKGAPRQIPIVAMTANVFREDIEKCLAAGMDDHVGKPLDLNEVLETLRKHLGHR